MIWNIKAALREEIGRLKEVNDQLKDERNSYISTARSRRIENDKLKLEIASLQTLLASVQSRCDRAELELDRTKADFHELVLITAGRVPPRLGQPLLDVDPFAEDTKQLEVFLTPDPNETGDVIEDVLGKMSEIDG